MDDAAGEQLKPVFLFIASVLSIFVVLPVRISNHHF